MTIDQQVVEVPEGSTILDVAKRLAIKIPTLCYLESLDEGKGASCRICVVEIEGRKKLAPSCGTLVSEGMIVKTNTDRVINARKLVLELLLANHPLDCMTCEKAGGCQLQDYCYEYDVKDTRFKGGEVKDYPLDSSNQFFYRDQNKCILCGRCVRVCNELQCVGAIGFDEKGFKNNVTPPFGEEIAHSSCVSCGNCVSVCPVGALMPKSKEKYRTWEVEKKVKTTCPYCGVGCQMELVVRDNRILGVDPTQGLPNNGLLCVKGKFGHRFINHPDRLKTPLIRKEGKLVEASWDEALKLITSQIKAIKAKHGPDALGGFSSARVTNEENYLFQKMVRVVFGSNNVDHCARLCHASTVTGLATTLGSGAMTNSIQEVLGAEVIFVTGSNTTETHPIIGAFMRQAKAKGAKIIVAEPRRITLAQEAEVFIQLQPGTNVALYNGMMHVIIDEGLQDMDYIKERTENYEELLSIIREYNPERVAKICGVHAEDIRKAARMYSQAEKASIFYSMGVTQHTTGTQGVMSISNLALLCGNIGKESCGVNPLRGQNNVQGACDLGALPSDLPGYQKVFRSDVIKKFEDKWNAKLSSEVGLTVTEMIKAGEAGRLKFLYIMGENPMVSDPDLNHVKKALKKIDFIVVQDIFLNETTDYADVVLPAASFAEKDGTFTNTERRIQRVRKAIEPIGDSKADWEIIMRLMNECGYKESYGGPSDIMNEIASLTPQYGGISYQRIKREGIQWPCGTNDHEGTKYLHKGKCSRGKGLFKPARYVESAELPDADYPYILTTGRLLYHFHSRTMTGRVEGLNQLSPESFIEVNPLTAKDLGVIDGELVKVISRRGQITTSVKIKDIVDEEVVFMPFHFADGAANYLTNSVLDPIAKIPELKVCAVRIEKIDHNGG